jgi:hypothetical protein
MKRFKLMGDNGDLYYFTSIRVIAVLGAYLGELKGLKPDSECVARDVSNILSVCRSLNAYELVERRRKDNARKSKIAQHTAVNIRDDRPQA